mmetsp:Transcript_11619/g.15748  ORF Transcript_11619/g.15748 Transcript_11619/m.15748 type:complete len:141 (+) Transcript_11619:712-1134(+)|eukprot:CAMPEP_0185590946 /NCGR_PEP_ID=MMETSP0434-20130131/62761_1 /TAXON_ID=626734 ORGANISM="Favella taraikaensis, Strain Fe Narragansett Bay" /NCGR_SAMPLE_ID=MMETSP0434 /ASSEMBLY_ACC=CAM_ASM_000379 /LENGTH=140 /DNA_ID=CAMNT_0028215569 /DNA_START=482 /DNA_END=904 /DNA_ORIENTATION=-
MVAPYVPSPEEMLDDNDTGKMKGGSKLKLGSRYKCNILDDDVCDFSRDEVDAGIGSDDDERGNVLFDDEDLFGEKGAKKTKSNRSKMLLDELEGGVLEDTDHSFRQPTLQDEETGALNSDRAMVRGGTLEQKRANLLTKS